MRHLIFLLYLVLITNFCNCKFEPTGNCTISTVMLDAEYTTDQKYIIFAFEDYIQIHNGITIQLIQQILFDSQFTFSSLAVSQDSTMFAVGFRAHDNSTRFKIYQNGQIEKVNKVNQLKNIKISSASVSGQVTSLCFNADNTYVVLGTPNGDIIIWQYEDQTIYTFKFADSIPITSIACSPFRSLQFTIAGGLSQTSKKLATYEFDPITEELNELKNYTGIDQEQIIFDIVYSPEGDQIYRVGSSQTIYINSVDQNESQQIPLPKQMTNIHKIRISKKEDVIVISNGKQIWIRKTTPDQQDGFQYDNYTTISPAFGLGPHGANILYVTVNNTGQILGQCPLGQYLNDATDTCDECDPACSICFNDALICYACHQGNYLQEFQCLSCVENCKVCSDSQECQNCYDPFILNQQKLCGCPKGKFVDEDTCTQCQQGCLACTSAQNCLQCDEQYYLENGVCQQKQGEPKWGIILSVALLIGLAIIIISMIALKLLKKTTKKSAMLTDYEDEISSI